MGNLTSLQGSTRNEKFERQKEIDENIQSVAKSLKFSY